jgi:hypothetical protein
LSEATAFSEADIYGMPEPEAGKATRTFRINGKDKTFTIETGGHLFAEKWAELLQCQMYGQTQKMIQKATNKPYAEEFDNPGGKKIVITDPSYMGSLRMLHAVLVPKMPFGSLVIFGHRAGGKTIEALTKWAEDENGMSAYAVQKLEEISKNLQGGEDSRDRSDPPV